MYSSYGNCELYNYKLHYIQKETKTVDIMSSATYAMPMYFDPTRCVVTVYCVVSNT